MPKYTVLVTRDVTESVAVEVEALNDRAAQAAALEQVENAVALRWERDDETPCNSAPYVTDTTRHDPPPTNATE